jgi:hypothetical protein
MEKSTAIPGEAGSCRNALRVVIGGLRIHVEKTPRVLLTKAGESSPPPYPL